MPNTALPFIKDHDGRIADRSFGNGKQLTLSLRQTAAVAYEHRIILLRQHLDEAVRIDKLPRRNALLIRRLRSAEADIVHHGAGEEVGLLSDKRRIYFTPLEYSCSICSRYFLASMPAAYPLRLPSAPITR